MNLAPNYVNWKNKQFQQRRKRALNLIYKMENELISL